MKGINFNSIFNYSKVGKISAKIYSQIFKRGKKYKKILRGKKYKSFLENNYLDKEDKETFEENKDFNHEDIFDENYVGHFNQKLGTQKKYFNHFKSCAINKTIYQEKKENKEDNKNTNKEDKPIKSKGFKNKKYIILKNSPNNDFIYKKILYTQSFDKMIGRDDLEKKKQRIEERLKSLNKKNIKNKKDEEESNIGFNQLNINYEKNNLSEKEKEEQDKKDSFKTLDMNRMLKRGRLPKHHDVRIRTAKGFHIKGKNSFSRKLHKNVVLINDNKKYFDEKLMHTSKRQFSGLSHQKEKINKSNSFFNNIFFDKSPKKELLFKHKFINKKRAFSSKIINHPKNNILHEKNNNNTFNSMNRTNINFSENESRKKSLLSKTHQVQSAQNSGLSFKNMLSREYVNRIHINKRIGVKTPLSPRYSSIFPKVINSVKYSLKHSLTRKTKLRDIGIKIEENNNNGYINPKIDFTKMFVRGDIDSKYPMYMNKINTRNVINSITAKSLKMNQYSKRRFSSPKSSFNNRKSFNSNLDNINSKIIHNSIENIKETRQKKIRIKNFKNNIQNIFKKIIFDGLIERNDISKDELDLKKNPKLRKQINSKYKNIFSDYYKMNLDFFEKDYIKKKIDGITFQEIKSRIKINKNVDTIIQKDDLFLIE